MTDRTPNQHIAELLNKLADIDKELGELSITMIAQNKALGTLIPGFETQLASQLASERCQRVKLEYEHRIGVLREAAQKLSKS
jgi:hypothetical protein